MFIEINRIVIVLSQYNHHRSLYLSLSIPFPPIIIHHQVEFLVTKFRPTKTGKVGNVGQFSTEFTPEQNKAAIGKSVIVSTNKEKEVVLIHTKTPLSKKYIKFLIKKYLKKNQLRDLIRLSSEANRKEISLKFYTALEEDLEDEENVE